MIEPTISLSASAASRDAKSGRALAELASAFTKKGIDVKVTEEVLPQTKGAIVIGLTIAGLTLTTISTLMTVLAYFRSKQPDFSVKLVFEGVPISATNLSEAELKTILEAGKKNVGHLELQVTPASDSE